MDANSELDLHVGGKLGVLRDHAALNFYGTASRVDRAGKLNEHSVASRLPR